MNDQPLLSVDEALAAVLAAVRPLAPVSVPLPEARGRYLARQVNAELDLPPFANSAMDGYALRSADTPGRLRVVGESAAGRPFDRSLGAGEAIAISTGAAIPDGADTVVMIERATVLGAGAAIEVGTSSPVHDNVRNAGSDVKRGQTVLDGGALIGPPQIGAAASLGLAELPVRERPRVAVLPTGDELRRPGEPLAYGQIYNSNGPMLRALFEEAGAVVIDEIPAIADTPEAHRDALRTALEFDLVVSSGGVSVGPHDLVRAAGRELGVRELFWRIAMKPGKPLSFGVRERTDGAGPCLVFGIPGNPVSTLVCFELFVKPALRALAGAAYPEPSFGSGVLARAVDRNPEREEFVRVHANALSELDPLQGQQSHQISTSAGASGLARIARGDGRLEAGTMVPYLPLGTG